MPPPLAGGCAQPVRRFLRGRRHYEGRDAIRAWLAKEIAGDRVTMFVTEILHHPGGVAVLAKVTGDYDKTGLPDPLELRFYFTLAGDAIVQLVMIPAKRH